MGCYFQPMARMSGIDVAYCMVKTLCPFFFGRSAKKKRAKGFHHTVGNVYTRHSRHRLKVATHNAMHYFYALNNALLSYFGTLYC